MKNFLRGLAVLLWLGLTFTIVRILTPSLMSSQDNFYVVIGFSISVVWLLGSGCYGYHLLKRGKTK